MKMKTSRLLAVTLLTPNKMVLSSFPCDVLKPCLSTKPTQPLSVAVHFQWYLNYKVCITLIFHDDNDITKKSKNKRIKN